MGIFDWLINYYFLNKLKSRFGHSYNRYIINSYFEGSLLQVTRVELSEKDMGQNEDLLGTCWEPIGNFYENTMSISWELHLGGGVVFRALKWGFERNGFSYIHLSY